MAFAIGKLFNKRRDYEFVLIALPVIPPKKAST